MNALFPGSPWGTHRPLLPCHEDAAAPALAGGFMVAGLSGASYGESGTEGAKAYLPPLALSQRP